MIYENIKKICKKNGIAISRIEDDLKFPRSSICKWNINIPSVIKANEVANYLGVSIEDLLLEDKDEDTNTLSNSITEE